MHLGVDLGGTKIEIIAMDSKSSTLLRERCPTPQGDYSKTLDSICQLVHQAEQKLNKTGTLGIGIPGCISAETGLVKNANSTCLIGKPLKEDLEKRLQRSINIANDADCFVLSEAIDGAAAQYNNVFGIILGTGVGGGIVINKHIINGPNSITGEWGHNALPWLTESDSVTPCYCGKKGCIETFLSGPGMSKQYGILNKKTPSALNPEDIFILSQADQKLATDCVNQYIDQLARSLASVINILDPEVIVFGGGLSNIDRLYAPVTHKLADYIFSDTVNTKIVKAHYGDSSGVRGAAWLGKFDVSNSLLNTGSSNE